MRNFIQFIQYHNAVPIAVSILVLGAGGVFAATDPEAVLSSNKKVVSVDNSYLVGTDLATYSPSIQIENVSEDADTYYVTYRLATIDVDDAVWRDVVRTELLRVTKAELGAYRDLGVFVTDVFKNIVDREHQRLVETQVNERPHPSQKVIATEYSGLIGKFLDTTTEQLPGYTPVVQPPPSQEFVEVPAPSMVTPSAGVSQTAAAAETAAPQSRTNEPILSILGNNPADVPVGSSYSDLGAVISSTPNNYAVHVYFDGNEVQQVSLDTSKTGEYVITYRAWNEKGETGVATRLVRVIDPNAPAAQPDTSASPAPQSNPEPASPPSETPAP